MQVLQNGKPFSGITYNQGSFTGDRGHLFIQGSQQCSYGLNLHSANRIYQNIRTIAQLKNVIDTQNVCKQCAKNVGVAISNTEKLGAKQ
jgi:hypothetical protein